MWFCRHPQDDSVLVHETPAGTTLLPQNNSGANMRNSRMTVVMVMFVVAACSKASPSPADSSSAMTPAAAATADMSAERAKILAADSAWFRAVIAKNLDSVMVWYTPDAVSYGFGPPATTPDKIRANYAEFVKSKVENPTTTSGGVEFSNDGTMAYDHGTYSMTVTAPGKKPEASKGAYLNVWRKVDGQWRLVAEMSTPN